MNFRTPRSTVWDFNEDPTISLLQIIFSANLTTTYKNGSQRLPGNSPVELRGGGIKGAPESRLWLRWRPREASVRVGESFSDIDATSDVSSPGRVTETNRERVSDEKLPRSRFYRASTVGLIHNDDMDGNTDLFQINEVKQVTSSRISLLQSHKWQLTDKIFKVYDLHGRTWLESSC